MFEPIKNHEKFISGVEISLSKKLGRLFYAFYKNVMLAYRHDATLYSVDEAILQHRDAIDDALKSHYIYVSTNTIDAVAVSAEKYFGGVNLDEYYVEQRISEWIKNQGLMRSKTIAQTSRALVRDAMEPLILSGAGESEVSKAIRNVMSGNISNVRSRLIARTESHTASMNAIDTSMRHIGLGDLKKVWVPSKSERTRDWHEKMIHHPPVAIGEMFDVGGDQMEYPGDSRGSARNVCNCRCVVKYV
jgi:hypothetical protein